MAGKSIEDILRQQAAQRQAQIQQQQAQERALNEQRERQRQDYLQRMRMFESLNNTNPSSAASAGGKRGNTTSISNESILYYNFNAGVFTYFIYNFESEVLTDVKEISLENGPSGGANPAGEASGIYPVTRGGFFIKSLNDTNSNYDLLFISLNGEVIWQDTSSNDSDVDIENFSRYIAAYYLKDGIWKLVVFNENGEIKSFDFQNPIEGGGYSYDDVWNGGFVVREDISDIQKFYIINFEAGTSTQFHEIDTNIDSLNIYLYAYSNKILTIKNGDLFEVFNSNGQKISEFDVLDEFDVVSYSYDDFVFLNDNGSFVLVGFIEDTRNIIFFSGESNEFSYKRVDTGDYEYYRYDVYSQKNYTSPSDYISEGSAIFMFYNNDNEIDGIDYYDSCIILPVFSTDSQLRDFYELTSEKGIVTDLDDNDVSITRNADHINLLIDGNSVLPDENYSILRFNREGDSNTIIPTNITKIQLDDDDQINGKTILQFERSFEENGTWGWDDLSDLEDRFFYSFKEANNNSIGNNVIGQKFVMKDIVNNKYWGIKFTEWEQSGGGGFAYTRQLISGGTFSGEIISFTFSDWINGVVDIIEPGVLEIKRDYYGPIYNSAVESESNGENLKGTLWNSEYVYGQISEYDHYIVNNEGQVVDKVTTASDYENHYEGATYILEDEIFHKTWVSNNQNDKEFQLLPNYYHNYEECNNTSNESGLRLGNFIISDGFKNRIITEDSISEEFITPSTGIISKAGDREVFYNGGCVITTDESNTIFYFYNISGELVGQKSMSEGFIEYSDTERGNRFSIRYLVDGKTNVILFNGTTIREFETNLGEIDISINDYNWWDND
jgi:hypothetical protein